MKKISLLLAALGVAGCISRTTQQSAYLAELPQTRQLQAGPCECTSQFLKEVGAAGVPSVIRALDMFSGSSNDHMRALIVLGASLYGGSTNAIVIPIMEHAEHDPAPEVSDLAKKWILTRRSIFQQLETARFQGRKR